MDRELDVLPRWVVAPELDAGSIDPLGDQARSDRIADELLPGLTVQTDRLRYLSFLAWAHVRLGRNAPLTDRWEVALAVGEHVRHGAGRHGCRFLGKNKVAGRRLQPGDPLPRKLHQQTARVQYARLYETSGMVDGDGEPTPLAASLASHFARHMPNRLPGTVRSCDRMPCLSFEGERAGREKARLESALLDGTPDADRRRATLSAVTRTALQRAVPAMLNTFLDPRWSRRSPARRLLHEAACHELLAYPLKVLFLELYGSKGALRAKIPARPRFVPFDIATDEPGALVAGVAAHLNRAEKLGLAPPKVRLGALRDYVLERHHQAKGDGAWVSSSWRVLRPGLGFAKARPTNFRLAAFSSLLQDCG